MAGLDLQNWRLIPVLSLPFRGRGDVWIMDEEGEGHVNFTPEKQLEIGACIWFGETIPGATIFLSVLLVF